MKTMLNLTVPFFKKKLILAGLLVLIGINGFSQGPKWSTDGNGISSGC